jgi:hypothetical protein
MRRAAFALTAVIAGVALLANPLYLDRLLVYPTVGDGFAIGGHYHAALAGLGLVLALGAVAPFVPDGRVDPVLAVAVGAVLLFVGYEAVVGAAMDPRETRILGYGHRKTFIVGVVASLFALGAAATSERTPAVALAPLLLGLTFVVVSRGIAGTLPLDLLLLLFSADLLGVPFLGGLAVAAAAVVGGVVGRVETAEDARPNRA